MLARLALVLLLAFTMSAPGLGETGPAPAPAARVQEFACTQDIGFFVLPLAGLQARLPAGFRAAAVDPVGASGAVFVGNLECARTLVDGVEAGPARETGTGILVDPPAGWAAEGIASYVVATFANTAPAIADAFAAWAIGAGGTVDLQRIEGPHASVGLARGSYDSVTFVMAAATAGQETPEPATRIRAFGVRDGVLTHVVDLTNEASTARGGLPGGARPPGGAAFAFEPSPYDAAAAVGFAQHARWPELALQWALAASPSP